MKILGIETSCDETAAAVVEDGKKVLSNVVVSQIDIFKEYGGVIPEVAARSHLEVVLPVVKKAMIEAGLFKKADEAKNGGGAAQSEEAENEAGLEPDWEQIDAIAVTHAPGLLGSLLIGTLTARTLAVLHDKPLYAVHHLKSHVYAKWLESEEVNLTEKQRRPGVNQEVTPKFPIVALLVSGGHTQILYMREHNHFEVVGTTRDDAVGECFDKVAKILGLPYPGGPSIAEAAKKGDKFKYEFPHPQVDGLDFSFSGLKTAVLRTVQKEVGKPISFPSHELAALLTPQQVADFAASFEYTAVKILTEKLRAAVRQYHPESVVVAGGVSANLELREALCNYWMHSNREHYEPSAETHGEAVFSHSDYVCPEISATTYFPYRRYSGDNGAMVAAAAYYEIQAGRKATDPYGLNIFPRVEIS